MSFANFKTVKSFISMSFRGFLFIFFFLVQVRVHAESKETTVAPVLKDLKSPAVVAKPVDMSTKKNDEEIVQAIRKAVQPVEPTHEIVILNTEAGFIPEKVRVKKGEAYKVHVVNLNMKEKNVSFLMDAFTQSHNTVYGVKKTFNIEPQVEGVYSYQCPETGIQGQLVVVKDGGKRKTASEDWN